MLGFYIAAQLLPLKPNLSEMLPIFLSEQKRERDGCKPNAAVIAFQKQKI